jgi:hypothetical protein
MRDLSREWAAARHVYAAAAESGLAGLLFGHGFGGLASRGLAIPRKNQEKSEKTIPENVSGAKLFFQSIKSVHRTPRRRLY